jgi:hypothetical protein
MKDLKSNIVAVQCIAPAVHAATKSDGTITDMQGASGATAFVSTGAISGAGLFVPTLVAGNAADLSDGATVTSAELIGSWPASLAADSIYSVGYTGSKRYLRVVLTKTSGTNIAASAAIVKSHLSLSGTV